MRRPVGPFNVSSGTIDVSSDTNYFELADDQPMSNSSHRKVRREGVTQDAEGCRGVCELDKHCSSFTWRRSSGKGSPAAGGDCYIRSDSLWYPNVTDPTQTNHRTASVVSGRLGGTIHRGRVL